MPNRYLRIRTPQTVDGVNLKYSEDGKIVYRETDAPLTAKPHLELENAGFDQIGKPHLKHTITEVSDETPLYTGRKIKTKEEAKKEFTAEILEELKASGFVLTKAQPSEPEDEKPAKKKKQTTEL